ncbi:nuclease-related domain-containing DEAD/DEAH box helicase [Natranaerofaba carboxydovora]|uniref:nuclease-related domain-containing DEAD/DEAH box helicase n=1 Tax=Natranaerofaba carboxydovora TaxID=2742683 RepID=UPI001F13702D|nr:NERD domain-containing protein [Natranaerofaba carboxydovora]UMZ73000.1 Nuclease-related domain protein [Natranaerofaba carboxydovora]
MARMVPPYYSENTSPSEKNFFEMLQSLSDEYFALHSLGIAEHKDKSYGEIDFVIICPKGILCLEVKGGEVYREEGIWRFVNDSRVIENSEGPFKQAINNMHSLRINLAKKLGKNDPIPRSQFACGVVFIDIPFTKVKSKTASKDPEIITDITFDSTNTSAEIQGFIDRCFKYWKDKFKEKNQDKTKDLPGGLSHQQMNRALNYLRGDFGFVPNLGYIIKRTEKSIITLTNEQKNILDQASENNQILLKGGAGTGKTLLCLEYARRAAFEGKSVLYLCFNRNLCQHIYHLLEEEKKDDDTLNNIVVYTLHNYITDVLKEFELDEDDKIVDFYNEHIGDNNGKTSITGNDHEFFGVVLPEVFVNTMESYSHNKIFDTLIVDEGQDLFKWQYLFCFDQVVSGGLKKGNWFMCYDPHQNIYTNDNDKDDFDYTINLIQEEYSAAKLNLNRNCRNTKPIGETNTLCTGFKDPTKFFHLEGESVVLIPYKDYQDEREKIIENVKKLLKENINPGEVVLLSRKRMENSCLKGENIFQGLCSFQEIKRNWRPNLYLEDSLKFCTVQSYKGLESPVVFLIDVDGFKDLRSRMLNYTGMSRAKSLLYIFYDENVDDELNEMKEKYGGLI